jgi:hypothetical protein
VYGTDRIGELKDKLVIYGKLRYCIIEMEIFNTILFIQTEFDDDI